MATDLQQFENFLKNLFFNSGTTKDFQVNNYLNMNNPTKY